MEQKVQEEIDALKVMVRRWYKFYLRCADGHKYDQVHVKEFDEVVDQQLSPYLQELARCEHLDKQELNEFYTWLGKKHQELSKAISEIKVEDKLLPCPFCGTEILEFDVSQDDDDRCWVVCSSCDASALIEQWNNRG